MYIASKLVFSSKEIVQPKLRNNLLTSPVEVNVQSADVADAEQLLFRGSKIGTREIRKKKKSANNVL